MERNTELLATFQLNQCQNAAQKLDAGSPLCFRCVDGWGHVPINISPTRVQGEITKELVRIPRKDLPN